jgi:hypothetical protein
MLKNVLLVSVGLVCGIIIGAATTYRVIHKINHDWRELQKENHGIAYSNEVFTESDIPLPDLKDPHGQAKFVDRDIGKGTELGFLVRATMGKLDQSKLPEKYKKPQTWGQVTLDPTESVTYTAHLSFTLKDADGFVLMTTESEPIFIESGEENKLQGLAKDSVPDALVQRTKNVFVELVIDKCETCRP